MNGKKKLIVGGVVAGGLMLGAAGLVIGVGVAHAEPGIYSYLELLHEDVTAAPVLWRGDTWLLNEGWGSCTLEREGYSDTAVMRGIRVDGGLPFSTNADVDILAAAEIALCPDQASNTHRATPNTSA